MPPKFGEAEHQREHGAIAEALDTIKGDTANILEQLTVGNRKMERHEAEIGANRRTGALNQKVLLSVIGMVLLAVIGAVVGAMLKG